MRLSIAITALLCTAALALGACGGSGEPATSSTAEVPGGADPAAVQVIDRWATALNRGDIDAAAGLFAIPSVAENGPQLIRIGDLAAARLFNESLPCGAELVAASPEGKFTVATFKLDERPGPGTCGSGTGAIAKTAFVIEDGKIAEWRRVANGGEQAPGRSI